MAAPSPAAVAEFTRERVLEELTTEYRAWSKIAESISGRVAVIDDVRAVRDVTYALRDEGVVEIKQFGAVRLS